MKFQEMKKNLKWKTNWMEINNRLDTVEEKISELEYIAIETFQKTHREKRL